ncbi:MAG: AMIN domain-containing protein, partial [Gemmatimonadota bacterium]|nr:AMIN domain-containing protein [Gemmatimonadota bacterium]
MTIAAMGSLLALAAPAAGATSGAVTNLRVDANSGQTELTIEIRGGEFRWSDFTLSNPTRVVVDITGARSSLPGGRYEGIGRGGISALRTSQYSADVVRVVVDLERTAGYEVSRVPEGLRVSFRSRTTAFEPWSAQRGGASPTAQPAANTTRQAQQQRRQARPITVSFYETDIRDVLASFAEYTGRSIIAGSGVE